MRMITKAAEPRRLAQHRAQAHSDYGNYPTADKDDLRAALVAEQKRLCCYCTGRIRRFVRRRLLCCLRFFAASPYADEPCGISRRPWSDGSFVWVEAIRSRTSTQTKETKMSDQEPTSSKPSHEVLAVIGEGKAAKWTRIGAAWPSKNGQGFSLALDFVPRDPTMRLLMLPPKQ